MSCVAIPTPAFSYTMNGVVLDRPVYATGIVPQGGSVPAGASFTLGFLFPSSVTQTALASGAQGLMTFANSVGDPMSGKVAIASVSSGSLFLVTARLLVLVPINRYVITTQFY